VHDLGSRAEAISNAVERNRERCFIGFDANVMVLGKRLLSFEYARRTR